ncbi:MAG: MFS transporter [Deltaproteobacteria bacterium]|jgi:predicted MFS family arabinose efflux permease|nr:MFS transporter [Deltaproteobacteria bacterium]
MEFSNNKNGLRSLFSGLLPLFILAHFGHHLLTALPIPLLPMIRSDFSLDYTQSGWVVSAFSLSYGFGQLPAGWLTDRIGPRLMITIGICGVALAGFFVGLSQTFLLMIIFLILMGLLGGGYHPASPPMISALVHPGNRGRALGLHMVGGSASFFLAPLIATAIAASWGWRGSFIGLAVPTTAFGILIYVVLGKQKTSQPTEPGSTRGHQEEPHVPGRLRHLVIFIVLSTFTGAMIFATMSFIPLFLVDHGGYSKETAGAFFAFLYAAGLWMSPLGGYLSDRWGRVPVMLTICFISGPVLYLLNWVSSTWGVSLLLLTIGTIIYVRMPVSEAYIIGQTSTRNRSTVLGIYFFGSMEGGGLLTPLMGYLIDHLGFYYSFSLAGASLVAVTFICSILLRGSRN